MPSDPITSNAEVLNSWKEVALYMGRGVRTVQRWEQDLGLPVRRPRGKARSAVIAMRSELDRWLLQTTKNSVSLTTLPLDTSPVTTPQPPCHPHYETHALAEKTHRLLARSLELCARSRYLSEQINLGVAQACRLSGVPNASALADSSLPALAS